MYNPPRLALATTTIRLRFDWSLRAIRRYEIPVRLQFDRPYDRSTTHDEKLTRYFLQQTVESHPHENLQGFLFVHHH